jgi:hypothetical protein
MRCIILKFNLEHLNFISSIHNIRTRRRLWLQPVVNLTSYQKGAHYESIRIFNMLSITIAELVTNKKHNSSGGGI